MKNGPSALLGAAAGAVVTVVILTLTESQPATPPDSNVSAAVQPPASTLPASANAAFDLSPVLSRLDELNRRLGEVEARLGGLASGLANGPDRTPAVFDQRIAVDADALQTAMEQVERRKLEALSDETLRNQARQQMKGAGDLEGAIERLQVLLGRQLTPETRAEVMTELAMLQRQQGKEGRDAATRTLQAVIDTRGMGDRLGVAAAQQLVWTLAKEDPARALTIADGVVRSAGATPEQRFTGRWAAAIVAQQLGDTVRARADFQALLREIDGQPGQEKLVDDIRRRLEGL